jgi:hypothetical protein
MKCGQTEISDMTDWNLLHQLKSMKESESNRLLASQHPKFNTDRTINSKTVKKQEFPAINPNFIELKNAIIEEINKRKLITY